jgi:hypothetical protein
VHARTQAHTDEVECVRVSVWRDEEYLVTCQPLPQHNTCRSLLTGEPSHVQPTDRQVLAHNDVTIRNRGVKKLKVRTLVFSPHVLSSHFFFSRLNTARCPVLRSAAQRPLANAVRCNSCSCCWSCSWLLALAAAIGHIALCDHSIFVLFALLGQSASDGKGQSILAHLIVRASPFVLLTFSAGCLRLSHLVLSWLCVPLTF